MYSPENGPFHMHKTFPRIHHITDSTIFKFWVIWLYTIKLFVTVELVFSAVLEYVLWLQLKKRGFENLTVWWAPWPFGATLLPKELTKRKQNWPILPQVTTPYPPHPQSFLVCIEDWGRGKRSKAHQLPEVRGKISRDLPIEMGCVFKEAMLALGVLVDCLLSLTYLPDPVFI